MANSTAYLAKNRIHIKGGYIKGLHEYVPGATFSKTGGAHWSVPLSVETMRRLRKRLPNLEVDNGLKQWGKLALQREQALAKLAKQDRVQLHNVSDKILAAVDSRLPQTVGAAFIARSGACLIGDPVAAGKTLQTIAGVHESGIHGPYLVVCPQTAIEAVWKNEIKFWTLDLTIPLVGTRAKREAALADLSSDIQQDFPFAKHSWVLINPEMVRTTSWWECKNCGTRTKKHAGPKKLDCGHDKNKTNIVKEHSYPQLFDISWGAIIADESDQSILRISGTPNQVRSGMELLKLRNGGLKIAMSGTPFRSRPKLLWSTLSWLLPDEYTAFWSWVALYFEIKEDYMGVKRIGKLKRPKALRRSLRAIMLRRPRPDNLPPRMYIGTPPPWAKTDKAQEIKAANTRENGIWLPMETDQAQIYRQMERDAVVHLKGGELNSIGSLAEIRRLQQFSITSAALRLGKWQPVLPSNKFNYLLQLLNELGFPDEPETKVIVVSQFTKVLNLFSKELAKHKISNLMLTGETPNKDRPAIIEAFDRVSSPDSPSVLLLNLNTGGSAITLDAAEEMVFLDETYIPDDHEQVEGRIDNRRPEMRIVPRRYRYLRSLGTIEEQIAALGLERQEESDLVLKDPVSSVRQLFNL